MTTITREQQKQILIDTANHVISRDNTSPYSENLRELARIALASLEAEPVAYIFKHPAGELFWSLTDESNKGQNDVMPVYAAQPVQETGVYKDMLNIIGLLEKNEWAEHCTSTVLGSLLESEITRLVGKEQPAPVVPEKLPCSVELKPGLIIGKGCKTETLLTALRRRADYYAKIDAFTPEERAEHDASIEAFKAMLPTPADSQGRPRALVVPPAIEPDYKVIKSILPTANPDEYACCIAADMWNACRAAVLQGAEPVSKTYTLPELIEGMEVSIDVSTCDADAGNRYFGTVTEVSELDTAKNGYILLVQDAKPNFDVNGNSPVIPDGWISCSERMPAQDDWVLIYSKYGEYLAGQVQGEYVELNDGTLSWLGTALHWMPLPAAPEPEGNNG